MKPSVLLGAAKLNTLVGDSRFGMISICVFMIAVALSDRTARGAEENLPHEHSLFSPFSLSFRSN